MIAAPTPLVSARSPGMLPIKSPSKLRELGREWRSLPCTDAPPCMRYLLARFVDSGLDAGRLGIVTLGRLEEFSEARVHVASIPKGMCADLANAMRGGLAGMQKHRLAMQLAANERLESGRRAGAALAAKPRWDLLHHVATPSGAAEGVVVSERLTVMPRSANSRISCNP